MTELCQSVNQCLNVDEKVIKVLPLELEVITYNRPSWLFESTVFYVCFGLEASGVVSGDLVTSVQRPRFTIDCLFSFIIYGVFYV